MISSKLVPLNVLLFLASSVLPAQTTGTETKIYLVRHAEKTGTGDEAELSPAGARRAQELARQLGSPRLTAVYATDTQRARQTAAPVAKLAKVEVTSYPPHPPAEWFSSLLTRHRGQPLLIVGHSNTIPPIAEALGAAKGITWGDEEYDRLLELTIKADGSTTLFDRRYGPKTEGPAKRGFEISDFYRAATVRDLAVSPRGDRIAFTVARYDLEKGQSWTELYTAPPDGGELRQMTFDRKSHSSPVFSPDGETLIFVSNREEDSQLWKMPVAGGEARRLTSFSMEVDEPVFSADGKTLVVSAKVYPECGADSACNQKIADGWSEGKLQAHLADSLLYRHWTEWDDGKAAHVLLIDAASGEVLRDLTPGRWHSPVFAAGGGRGYDVSPDGKELCFASNRESDQAGTTNADLWVVPLEGGEAVNLTADNPGWDGAPLYSPDGRFIAYRSQATPGYESDLFRLAVYDRQQKTTRYLTDRPRFDNWITEMAWLPDSSGLIFQAELRGRTPLLRIELESGEIRPVLTDAQIDVFHPTPDGGGLVYVRRSIGDPTEVYRTGIDGKGRRALTDLNAALRAEVDLRPAEELWVRGDGEYDVQVYVVKPHDFDPKKKYPLILNVHGGPQSQWSDSFRGDWQVYPGKGYVVAFPNPTGSTGRGQDFTDAIGCDWGGRPYRDLMKVTDALTALPWIDADRMGSMGWSYGGYMMMWFQGQTDRFKTQAAMMGIFDLEAMYGATEELWFVDKDLCGPPWSSEVYERWSPSHFVESFKTPALVITGELDYRVPYTQSLQYFTALQKRGIPSRLVDFPGAGHWPGWYEMAFYYLVHLDWFHRTLGGGTPPWDVEKFLRNQVFEKAGPESPE